MQLIVAAMTWAQEHGVSTFDFLRGSEQLKDEFGAELQLDHFYERRVGITGRALAVKWGGTATTARFAN
jgi:CelD/BcsL family acetyltransferase involved in cellulose biosynthesis